MSDWRDEEYDHEPRRRPAPEGDGVRIIGSDAAAPPSFAAGDDETAGWPSASDDWATATGGWSSEAGGWSASGGWDPGAPAADPSGSTTLPHWTEPPTGEVPRILDDDTSDDLDSWSAVTAPRFRTDAGDWAAADFGADDLRHDDSTMVGALDEGWVDDVAAPTSRRARREQREAAAAKGRSRGRGAPAPEVAESLPGPGGLPGPGALEGPPRAPEPAPRPGIPEGGGPSAPTQQRVVTGLVAAAVAVVCFALGTVPTLILTTVIVGLAAAEFYEALRRAGYHPATLVGLLGCVAIVPIAYDQGKDAFPMMLFLVVAFSLLWYLFEVIRARPLLNVALTIMVFVYVGGFGAFAGLFLAADDGVGYILGIVLAVVAYDVVGWFVGSNMGRTPLMPRISPNKTVEGLLGGMAAAFVVSILVSNTVSGWDQGSLLDGILLGLVIAVMAPLGDLVESMIKRDLGVKDLGTMLPGHGGIADRFDALLFVLPAAYYVAVHIVS